jgi:hypothetical protein
MKYLIFLSLLSGCSYFKSKPVVSETAQEIPSWIYSPYDECSESHELCATGEARTFKEADTQAKNNLASIFEVRIVSDISISSEASQGMPWQADVRQQVQQSIKESVKEVLETVQIKKHFQKDGLTYALAVLDKVKASELLYHRLSRIDEELKAIWKVRQRTNFRKIVKLFLERERINERYFIVSGQGKPSPVSNAKIMKWRQERPMLEPIVLKVGQAPDWLTDKLKELLTEAGFKLIKGSASKILIIQVDSIKEYLNVEGFEKYTFIMTVTSIENNEKKKVITHSETVTGRSQADALLKIKFSFNEYLEQHLSDLHLD